MKTIADIREAFFDAIHEGDISKFQHCLDSGNADATWQVCFSDGTPLHCAALKGSAVMVKALLDKGADIDAENGYGTTPLFLAASSGHEEVVELLLERGCDVFKKQDGKTVRDKLKGDSPIAKRLKDWEEKTLAERKAAVEMKEQKAEQERMAAHRANLERLDRILRRKAGR